MKKRARRVGLGMQPRQAVEVSGVEVQPEVPPDAVLEGVEGNSNGGPLELESVQNLDSQPQGEGEEVGNELIVAQVSDFEPVPAVPQEAIDTLAAMMKQSEVLTGAHPEVIPFEEAAKMGLPQVEGADGYSILHGKQYAIGVDAGHGEDHGAAAVIRLGENGAADELVETLGLTTLGELPSGEYRATVRLAEGYVEGAKQQAEADGISLEDWLTIQLNAYLEQWWMAPGPR